MSLRRYSKKVIGGSDSDAEPVVDRCERLTYRTLNLNEGDPTEEAVGDVRPDSGATERVENAGKIGIIDE
jgi:hypothetical protein